MPIARHDRVVTAPDSPITVRPLAGQEATLVALGNPGHGSAVAADGGILYTPAPGFRGADEVGYSFRDAAGLLLEGVVQIIVGTPPVAVDDSAAGVEAAIEIAVLENDVDPDGDTLRVVGLGQPDHGAVELDATQRVLRYRSQAGFVGIDRFTYTIADPFELTASAAVTVAVEGVNRPPQVLAAEISTTPGTPVVVPIVASDPDGDALRLVGLGLPEHGRLAVNADRSVTYTPAAGFVGTDRFAYTLSDGRSGTVDGEVTVTVARRNTAPRAAGDSVTTATGSPVTIVPLRNDSDAEGDPLSLAALSLPEHGIVAVNADQSITYNATDGFVGTDRFAYTVRDVEGAVGRAEIAVTVTAAATPPSFGNGYSYRRRIVVPPQPAPAEAALEFVLFVDERGDWLKDAAHGGRVRSAQGHDIVFALEDGTALHHELDRYDPLTGALTAWVRLPAWDPAEQLRLFLYYGKAGVAAATADAAATWQGCLAVIDPATGADLSGHGRNMTATALTPVRLAGRAARFDGTASLLFAASPSWLDGKNAFTVAAWAKSEVPASDRGLLAVGPSTGDDAAAGLVLRHDATGSDGQARSWLAKARFADQTDARVESPAATATTAAQMVALRWASGGQLRLYLDGAEQPIGTGRPTGPTAMATGELRVGSGPSGGNRWQGLIGRVVFWDRAVSPALLRAAWANQADPQAFYGIGGEDAADERNAAPVAVPIASATTAGSFVDMDALALAYDTDAADGLRITAVGQPLHGNASLLGKRLRYAPVTGFVGTDGFSFTIGDGRKISTAKATVVVDRASGGGDPGGGEPIPGGRDYPAPLRVLNVASYDELRSAVGSALPGDHVVVADGRSLEGPVITVAKRGSADAPIVIRAQSKLGVTLKVPFTFAQGSAHCWLWGFKLHELDSGITLGGSYNRVRRCDIAFYQKNALAWARGEHCAVEYTVIRSPRPWNADQIADAKRGGTPIHMGMRYQNDDPRYIRLYKVGFYDCNIGKPIRGVYSSGQADAFEVGEGGNLAGTETFPTLEYVLVENWDSGGGTGTGVIDVKTSRLTARHVTLKSCPSGRFDFRGGFGHAVEDVWIEDSQGMSVHDRDHILNGVTLVRADYGINLMAGSNADGQYSPAAGHNRARNCRIANVSGKITVGGGSHPHLFNALDNKIEGCSPAPGLGDHENTKVLSTTSLAAVVPRKLTRADVGPDAE